jgi:hypothetical protein
VAQDANLLNDSWGNYFYKIREQCPWSWRAWQQDLIEITPWTGLVEPLGQLQARVYTVDLSVEELRQLADQLDEGDCEWLWSHPGAGPWATPVPVLIQQDRAELTRLRNKLKES